MVIYSLQLAVVRRLRAPFGTENEFTEGSLRPNLTPLTEDGMGEACPRAHVGLDLA